MIQNNEVSIKKLDGISQHVELIDKNLFLTYALPCGQVAVKRCTITQEQLDQEFELDPKIFKVGLFMCEQTAKKMGKDVIDKDVIHQYFWYDHDAHVDEVSRTTDDVEKELCTVYPGEYLGDNRVRLPIGERNVNISRTPGLKPGDYVTVHYQYTCEAITKHEFKKLWELKK